MPATRLRNAAILALLASTVLVIAPAQAGWRDRGETVLISPDGTLIRNVPELGSVRVIVDIYGRRLLLNDWDEVVAIEVPASQAPEYRSPAPQVPVARRGYDSFPPAPRPAPSRGFDNFASAPPPASIDRRDLNPVTGSVSGDRGESVGENRVSPQPFPGDRAAGAKLTEQQIVALQVFLDRKGMSPGVIDGKMGSNVSKALTAWQEASGEKIDPADTATIIDRLSRDQGLAFTTYTITAEDAAGPYVASIPVDYSEKARLERLSFTSTAEMLAERFHMDEAYLRELNPGADFTRQGTIIKVVAPGRKQTGAVTRIIADKKRKQVRAYDASGKLLAAYPATIGSSDTPSPTGEYRIERIAPNPGYTYNPKINFRQGSNDRILQLPPGPNGPVGSMWIALSKPTYGIHGTPEPSKIGKTESHGCVRLTNWDAAELAGMVKPGVTVSFLD